ncbi:COX15/CtaA family protein [Pasteuria penetrans]|uniref:COX15/CtaA family protein n=1 Tax=Pasteuria penetrans TaxID=86005 RepID=UPI000FA2D4AB|nr:COX15/CtaA family protein [Pasteuria penetrans]
MVTGRAVPVVATRGGSLSPAVGDGIGSSPLARPPIVPRKLGWLSWISTLASYVLLLGGSIVSKTESGDACGRTWPLCQGVLLPEHWSWAMLWEYSHRWVAGVVGILVITVAVLAWRSCGQVRFVRTLVLSSVGFVLLQAILGALTVKVRGPLEQKTVLALHFGFSMLAFASTALLTVAIHRLLRRPSEPFSTLSVPLSMGVMVYIGLVAIYLVAYTGAWVRHMHATLSCGMVFPHCHDGLWLPDWTTPAGIHRFHRWMAISLWLGLCGFAAWVVRKRGGSTFFRRRLLWVAAIFTGQLWTGIAVVLWGESLWIALLHPTLVTIGFTALAEMGLRVRCRSQRA